MTDKESMPVGEECGFCNRIIKNANRAVYLEMNVNTARATLIRIPRLDSQGWFWWHAKCAERSIKGEVVNVTQ